MSAQEFLRRVEQTGMVSEPLLKELRHRISETHRNMRPEMLAKLLVDRGELTAAQARKLVSQVREADQRPAPPKPAEAEEELGLAPEHDESDVAGDDLMGDDLLDDDLMGDDTLEPATLHVVEDEQDEQDELTLVEDEEELSLVPDEEPAEAILIEESEPEPEVTATAAPERPASPAPKDPAPPLDEILGEPLIDPLVAQHGAAGTRLPPRRHALADLFRQLFGGSQRPRKRGWDSPLILLGGGALIVLIATAFGLFALFYSETADEVFSAGADAYASQSYALAIKNFERFSSQFPQHEKAGLARVRTEMSKLRQFTDRKSADWESALEQAIVSLPAIKQERAIADARSELAKLLPDITQGLLDKAKQAETTSEKQRVLQRAAAALELVNNPEYLPTSVRKPQEIRIDEIESTMRVVERDIQRDLALAAAVQEIQLAADANRITDAYRLRDELITSYPLLADDVTLGQAIGRVTAKEREAVKVSESTLAASYDDHPPIAKASVVLSDQRGESIGGLDGHVLGVLVQGAVYGLSASDGQILWRRHVGFETSVFPQPVDPSLAADLLIVDEKHSEVQRVRARSGELLWRLRCPTPIETPRIYGDRAFVTCGRDAQSALLSVDLVTGKVIKVANFPVGCSAPVGVLHDRGEIIQVGAHSSVYVLDADSLATKGVFSLGHARGSVLVAPVQVGSLLVIAENVGSETAKLHVCAASEKDAWATTDQSITTGGQVITPPSIDGRRMLVATELGELRVFESPANGSALREVAALPGAGRNLGPPYTLMDRTDLWVANSTFSHYELQSTRGKLVAKSIRDGNDQFQNPLQRQGSYLFHVRRRAGMMGATVAATNAGIGDDHSPIWETDLGVPSAVLPGESGTVHAMTMNGALFEIDAAAVKTGTTSDRKARIDPRLVPESFSQQLDMGDDTTVFAGPPPVSHIVVADLQRVQLERTPLRIGPDQATTELVSFNGGILAASESGLIHLVDHRSGSQKTGPFMPRVEPGMKIDWLAPAPLAGQQFLAAEKSGRIYRVAADGDQMTMIKETKIDSQFLAGLASLGKTTYAVILSGGDEQLIAMDPQDLTLGAATPLIGGLAWGPRSVGEVVVVADRDNSIYAFDDSGNLKWRLQEPIGALAGNPLAMGDNMIFATTQGCLCVVESDGAVAALERYAEPFGSGPIAFKNNLLVSGWDGTVHVVNVPQ